MQELLPIEFTDFYVHFIGYSVSLLIMLWIKDAIGAFMEGMKFRTNKHFKEGDKVLLEGQQAMIISIGWRQSVFGVYGETGYTWRFIPNKKIESLKLEKIVDPDLHPDTAKERAEKLHRILGENS